MSVFLSPVGGAAAQFFDNNGVPLTGGKLFTYAGGTTTPQTSYTTIAGNIAHTNPIILDSAGRVPGGEIWLTDQSYKFVLNDADNVLIATYDNIFAIPPVSALDAATTPLTGSEILSIVQSGGTVKVSVANLTAGRAISASAATITGAVSAGSATITNNVGIGTVTPTLPLNIGDSTLPVGVTIAGQMISSNVADTAPLLNIRRSAASGNPTLAQFTSSGTAAVPTAVALNRGLGRNDWWGFDGTNYLNAAAISVAADGAVSAGVVPGRFVFSTATTNTPVERMRITSAGNVGIGASSPSLRLSIASSTDNDGIGITNTSNANTTTKATRIAFSGTSTTDVLKEAASIYVLPDQADYTNTTMAFYTRSADAVAEKMRLTSGGNLYIGTTSPVVGAKVAVNWNASTEYGLVFRTLSATYTAGPILFLNSVGVASGNISQSETIVSYNTSSDYRLKEHILPMVGALAKVAALKPCTYKWKADGSAGQGFIAHQLQEVIPDCVTGTKDAVDENGKIRPQGVDTSFLVATLTAAIQEQQAMIVQLQADVAALKSTN